MFGNFKEGRNICESQYLKRRNLLKNSFISSLGGGHWLRFGLIGVDWSLGAMQFEFVFIRVQLRLTEGEFPI